MSGGTSVDGVTDLSTSQVILEMMMEMEIISILMEMKYDRLPTSEVEILHQSGQHAFKQMQDN